MSGTYPREAMPDVVFPRVFGGVAAPPMLRDLLALVADIAQMPEPTDVAGVREDLVFG